MGQGRIVVLEIGEPWGPVGDLLEVVDGDFNVRGAGHGEQVQDSVSRATESVHDDDRVQEGVASEDIPTRCQSLRTSAYN